MRVERDDVVLRGDGCGGRGGKRNPGAKVQCEKYSAKWEMRGGVGTRRNSELYQKTRDTLIAAPFRAGMPLRSWVPM